VQRNKVEMELHSLSSTACPCKSKLVRKYIDTRVKFCVRSDFLVLCFLPRKKARAPETELSEIRVPRAQFSWDRDGRENGSLSNATLTCNETGFFLFFFISPDFYSSQWHGKHIFLLSFLRCSGADFWSEILCMHIYLLFNSARHKDFGVRLQVCPVHPGWRLGLNYGCVCRRLAFSHCYYVGTSWKGRKRMNPMLL